MQLTGLSIILPVRNIAGEISGILRSIASQADDLNAEYIVVDMGSTDQTVLESVQLIKELKLRGCVIQNGNSSVSAALNTGIQKSGGEYITFIFARRLYHGFMKGYFETAQKTEADFVFGSISESDAKFAERRTISKVIKKAAGADYVKEIIRGNVHIDISAILLRHKFIMQKQIRFNESCAYGYAEEFVYRCLLAAETIVQSPTILVRDNALELKRGKLEKIGNRIFQHTDAILRIADIVKTNYPDNNELAQIISYQKLPFTIMRGVDLMLKEGNGYSAVRGYLKVSGYDKLLVTGKQTDKELKRRVLLWRTVPWIYQPK
ncbi:MAG TPA: glycosyltransferase [Oscillospiraceae bacterium]|nr:glycosyltransferase [Oscillospiraceae bacterium]